MVSLYPAVVVGDFGIDDTSDWTATDTSFSNVTYDTLENSTFRRFNHRSLKFTPINGTATYLYKQFTSDNIMNYFMSEYHQMSWANSIGCWMYMTSNVSNIKFMYHTGSVAYTPSHGIDTANYWYWGEATDLTLTSIYKAGFYHDGTGSPTVYADTYVIFNKDTSGYDIIDGLSLFTTRSIVSNDGIHYTIEGFLHGTDLHDRVSQLRSFVTEGLVENTPLTRPLPALHSLVEDGVKPYLLYDTRKYAVSPYPRIAETVIIPLVISSVNIAHYSQRTKTVEVRIEGVKYGGI